MFVSQSAQVLALLFAGSCFLTLTPQGGSQKVVFVASAYFNQGELYRLGLTATSFCTNIFLVIGGAADALGWQLTGGSLIEDN